MLTFREGGNKDKQKEKEGREKKAENIEFLLHSLKPIITEMLYR